MSRKLAASLTTARTDFEASKCIVSRHPIKSNSRARLFENIRDDLVYFEDKGIAGRELYNTVASMYGKMGLLRQATFIKDRMNSMGHSETIDTYRIILSACATRGDPVLFNQIWSELLKSGIPWKDSLVLHQILVLFIKVGASHDRITTMFYSLCELAPPNKDLIEAYLGTFSNCAEADAELQSSRLSRIMTKYRISSIAVTRGLLTACSNGKDSNRAKELLPKIRILERTVWDYESFICSQTDIEVIIDSLNDLKRLKTKPTSHSLSYMLSLCTTKQQAASIFKVIEDFKAVDSTTVSALLQFYITHGDLELSKYLAHSQHTLLSKNERGRTLLRQLGMDVTIPKTSFRAHDTRPVIKKLQREN
eukprot:TRINITY_DN37776_c0_g1_i1.p1 TRINITY_DN37776_c0_g1~~TRINITY_DN37776_c0_g1_i1.p1  ORF type:complete len:365 (+),score=45.96 TRINITY_DN37776_c0_g1_i1:70-1164(+)